MSYCKGEMVYYQTWYGKLIKVEIIDKRTLRHLDLYATPYSEHEYIIKFPNGKLKIIKEDKLF